MYNANEQSFIDVYDKNGAPLVKVKNFIGDTVFSAMTEIDSILPINVDSRSEMVYDYKLYGKTVQPSTPDPDNPVEVEGVGERTENLFDFKTATLGKYIRTDGTETNSTGPSHSQLNHSVRIPIIPNTAYTLYAELSSSSNTGSFCWYNTDNEIVERPTFNVSHSMTKCIQTFVSPATASSLVINYITSDQKSVMLTPGSTPPSSYIPYGYQLPISSGGVTTPMYIGEEPLHKIGDYADYVDYRNQKIVRRVKKLVLTGEESWGRVSSGATAYFRINLGSFGYGIADAGRCTHFRQYSINSTNTEISFDFYSTTFLERGFMLAIRPDSVNATSISAFTSFLTSQYAAGTPVTVWYVLAEPEDEDLPAPIPTLPLVKGYSEIAYVGEGVEPSEAQIKGRFKEILEKPTIYGFHIDPSISDPAQAVTYLADAMGKTPAAMGASSFSYGDWGDAFFMPKPCMLRYDGTVAYYLDPEDYSRKIIDGEYRQVEYLRSTGTQFIITDHILHYNDTIETDVSFGSELRTDQGHGWFIGLGISSSAATEQYPQQRFAATVPAPNPSNSQKSSLTCYIGHEWTETTTGEIQCNTSIVTTKQHLVLKRGVCSYGPNTLDNSRYPLMSATPNIPMAVFGLSGFQGERIFASPCYRRDVSIYGVQVYRDNSLLVNLIPVERISDGELGMYDTLTGKYYTNAGTGTFVKGGYVANSNIADSSFNGNAMMEWPLIWYKFRAGSADGEGYFYCSDQQVDSSYKCWCNINSQNEITKHFYTAIYNGTGTSKLRSLSGVQLTQANGSANTSGQQELDRALENNASNSVEWYTETWSDRLLISALLILISKTLNNQAAFGKGLVTGFQTAKDSYVTGTLDDKGLFWGDISSDASGVKVFGMENFYGCIWRRIAGLIGTSAGFAYKLTYGTADGSSANGYNDSASGYQTVTGKPSAHGNVKTMHFGPHGFLPAAVGGDETDYWSEYFYTGSSGYAIVGGGSYGETRVGATNIALDHAFSAADSLISTVLSCKPVSKN